MAFQPTAFQFNAFQTVINSANRSGVIRLWLMSLTEKINTAEVIKDTPQKPEAKKLQTVVENADGSATIDKKEVKKKASEVAPIKLKPAKPLKREVTEKDYIKLNLPSPTETAEYLLNSIVLQAENQVWAEGQVLALLKQAVEAQREEAQDEELILNLAVSLMA